MTEPDDLKPNEIYIATGVHKVPCGARAGPPRQVVACAVGAVLTAAQDTL